jgi:hypothetical protein
MNRPIAADRCTELQADIDRLNQLSGVNVLWGQQLEDAKSFSGAQPTSVCQSTWTINLFGPACLLSKWRDRSCHLKNKDTLTADGMVHFGRWRSCGHCACLRRCGHARSDAIAVATQRKEFAVE